MGVPLVSSTSPAGADVNVYLNKVLTVTFSEALDPDTVNTGTFFLRNTDTDELVPVVVSLDSTVVSITPIRHLVDTTAYKLIIVGSDTALSSGPIESLSTGDALALTVYVVFTTGTEIEVSGLEKTEEQQLEEGEIDLPTNIQVVTDPGYLTIISSTPQNREFGVDPALTQIQIDFDENLSTSAFNEDWIEIEQTAYYEEDDPFLALPESSECRFQWQEPKDILGNDLDFSDMTGSLTLINNSLVWIPDEQREFPRNTKIRVILHSDIEGVSGNTLGFDYEISFYISPCPDVVSVDRVRDELFPYGLTLWTDDIIGKTIYKNAMNAMTSVHWQFDNDNINKYFREYVLQASVVDILNAVRLEDELQSGQFKRLGDLAIRFDSKMAEPSQKQRMAMNRASDLKAALERRFNGSMRWAVKGQFHPDQRMVWRTRLWKSDLCRALEGMHIGPKNMANSADERATKVQGYGQNW